MFRKFFAVLCGLLLALQLCPAYVKQAKAFSGGDGSEMHPYIVGTAAELDAVRNELAAHYRLSNDIDLTGYLSAGKPGYNGGEGWEPLGDWWSPFAGVFDGNGYRITGLWMERPGMDQTGLFGYVHAGGRVENLSVKTAAAGVIGKDQVGMLAGSVGTGSLVNCAAEGYVKGDYFVGGLVGYAGGGEIYTPHIADCRAAGSVASNTYYAGGLVGFWAGAGTVAKCYASADVTSKVGAAGGFVGSASLGRIENCYAMGSVSCAGSNAGGFAGVVADYGAITIDNCYAVGSTSGGYPSRTGGIVGWIGIYGATLTDCFFDLETTGQTEGIGSGGGPEGKSSAEMKTKSTFTDAGWDFTAIWDISAAQNSGYPFFLAPISRTRGESPQMGDGGGTFWLLLGGGALLLAACVLSAARRHKRKTT